MERNGSPHSFTVTRTVVLSRRVQLQKMEIARPPADIARYTMVFHKRDVGNEVNKDRLVKCCFSVLQVNKMWTELYCRFELLTFPPLPARMKLLVQTSQVWRKDGLNSCSYKTLSVERMPLYVNVTVDIGKPWVEIWVTKPFLYKYIVHGMLLPIEKLHEKILKIHIVISLHINIQIYKF